MSMSPMVSALLRRELPQATSALRDHALVIADRVEHGQGEASGRALQDSVADLLDERDPFEDLDLGLRAEARDARDLVRLARGAEVGEALDLQLVVQGLDLLRPQTRHAQERDEAGRGLAPQGLVFGQAAGGDELGDLREHRLADARHLGERAVVEHRREVIRQRLQGLRRVVIGPATKRVLAANFQQGAHLVEDAGDAGGFHEGGLRAGVARNQREVPSLRLRALNLPNLGADPGDSALDVSGDRVPESELRARTMD